MNAELQDLAFPGDREGPVFAAPWEARAFAIVLQLHQEQHYDWSEWVEYLSQEIDAARQTGHWDQPYYEQWLVACEKLLLAKGYLDPQALSNRIKELAEQQRHDHDHLTHSHELEEDIST